MYVIINAHKVKVNFPTIDRFTSGHDPFRNLYRLYQLLLLCQMYVPIKGARSRGEPAH